MTAKPWTKAQYAREVAVIGRRIAEESAAIAEGMWNPHFCSADATYETTRLCDDLEARLSRLRDMLRETA